MTEAEKLEVWHNLLFGQRSMMLRLGARLKRNFGLTIPHFEALIALHRAENGAITATELSRTLLYSSGSTTNLIKRMEEMGLVVRAERANDARVVLVCITPHGTETIKAAAAAHRKSIEEEFFPLLDDAVSPATLEFSRRLASQENPSPSAAPST